MSSVVAQRHRHVVGGPEVKEERFPAPSVFAEIGRTDTLVGDDDRFAAGVVTGDDPPYALLVELVAHLAPALRLAPREPWGAVIASESALAIPPPTGLRRGRSRHP
jgi:hypothetical protein